jgi:hypothetical protein
MGNERVNIICGSVCTMYRLYSLTKERIVVGNLFSSGGFDAVEGRFKEIEPSKVKWGRTFEVERGFLNAAFVPSPSLERSVMRDLEREFGRPVAYRHQSYSFD